MYAHNIVMGLKLHDAKMLFMKPDSYYKATR